MEEKYGFIYITTNIINGKKYIGQKKYVNGWKEYLGSGIALNNAVKKYGKEKFSKEIIEECTTREEANEREKYWIAYYNAVNNKNYYNIALGGDGGNTTSNYSKEEKFLIYQKANIGKNIGLKNAFAKSVICLNTMEVFETIESAGKKYNISPTAISKCCKNFPKYKSAGNCPETGERLTWKFYIKGNSYIYIPYKYIKQSNKVKCITTGEIYNSAKEAAKILNLNAGRIRSCCNGNLKTSGKLEWCYI